MEVKFEHISKKFGRTKVLNDINMVLESGKILCLIGPSGAGKTTLIRILTGALKADAGEVTIGNIKIPNRNLTRNIGIMPQNDAVYLDITGKDNLLFYGSLFGIKRNELNKRIDELLELMELSDSKNKLVSKYSGGMKKRLSLAIAILHEPELLVLDEPTVGIDPLLRSTIWEEFRNLQRKGKTIIVSTHVMDEVRKCDEAALLYGGKIVACDSVDNLMKDTQDGNIEELFLREARKGN